MTTQRRRTRRAKPAPPPPSAQQAVREAWKSAKDALGRAEAEV